MPRRVYRRRKARTVTMRVKCTRTIQFTHTQLGTTFQSMNVRPSDFAEFTNLAPSFERVKIIKLTVRVHPHQNVSNNSTSRTTNYAIVPYHRPVDTISVNFPTALSIDRAKVYRSTACGRMSFVPLCRTAVQTAGTGSQTKLINDIWRPTLSIGPDATDVNLYCGFIAFEGVDQLSGSQFYTIIQDLHVKFINQRGFVQ